LTDDGLQSFRENDFFRRIRPLLPDLLNAVHIVDQPRFKSGYVPDLLAILNDGTHALVEIKGITPNTQARLDDIVEEVGMLAGSYQETYPGKQAKLVLIVPGVLSAEHIDYLHQNGIDMVIDGAALLRAAGMRTASDADFFRSGDERSPADTSSVGDVLLQNLDEIVPGPNEWSRYQKLCGDILEFLFCPPLGKPKSEYATREGHNRRDFILRNYRSHQFWEYMRSAYEAHYIVVDAKNSARMIRKSDILQIANYLSPHGPGLFAIIMSRNGSGGSANIIQREQWAFSRKMIVIVDDADVRQMITMRSSDDDPAELLAQKIEDFRLGY
jgi:hypothetical protein